MTDKDEFIRNQSRQIQFLMKRIGKLEKENAELKACLLRDIAEQTVAYRDIKDKLDRLQKPLLELIIKLCGRFERAVSYRDILKASENHPALRHCKAETITRQVRKLAEKGKIFSPERGKFYPKIEPQIH